MIARYSMVTLIERKKLGLELTVPEIGWLCAGFSAGRIPDYQMAAWLMAVRLQGMSSAETNALTAALVSSGESLVWPSDRPTVDKHSTGGVGDKTSIVLVPLLAAAGLTFVKMSGRGLGLTGGTVDKLEAITGMRMRLSLDEIRSQADRIGAAMVGQSEELVPADGALYALRDVTSTVDSRPLIASSVMAKKIATGARAIVLDVKFGAGAFIQEEGEAIELAAEMVSIGKAAGRRIEAVLSRNDQPLGFAVGNALEVREAIDTLRGGGPQDLRDLTLDLGSRLMVLSGATKDVRDARRALILLLDGGVGLGKLKQIIEAQDGDPRVVDDPDRLPAAPVLRMLEAPADGVVTNINARNVAEATLSLGAGRTRKEDPVDPRTGVRLLVRAGDRVAKGDAVAEIHAATSHDVLRARALLLKAFAFA